MPPLPPIPPHIRFTRAELEVLEAIADGKGYVEICLWLGIQKSTVATHVKHIIAKIGPMPDVQPFVRITHWLWEIDRTDRSKRAA